MTQNYSIFDDARELLISSILQYEKMAALLDPIADSMDSASLSLLHAFNNSYNLLQGKIKDTDANILALLKNTDVRQKFSTLIDERSAIQNAVLQKFNETASHAAAVKSILASEMSRIKHGRQSLTGYSCNKQVSGRSIINRKS